MVPCMSLNLRHSNQTNSEWCTYQTSPLIKAQPHCSQIFALSSHLWLIYFCARKWLAKNALDKRPFSCSLFVAWDCTTAFELVKVLISKTKSKQICIYCFGVPFSTVASTQIHGDSWKNVWNGAQKCHCWHNEIYKATRNSNLNYYVWLRCTAAFAASATTTRIS